MSMSRTRGHVLIPFASVTLSRSFNTPTQYAQRAHCKKVSVLQSTWRVIEWLTMLLSFEHEFAITVALRYLYGYLLLHILFPINFVFKHPLLLPSTSQYTDSNPPKFYTTSQPIPYMSLKFPWINHYQTCLEFLATTISTLTR